MADRDDELNFFQGIRVRTDITSNTSIWIRPMTPKFDKQVHLGELAQMRQTKQVMVTSSRQNYVTNYKNYISTPECS